MNEQTTKHYITQRIIMYVNSRKIVILCPYAHYGECAAYQYTLNTPIKLDAIRNINGLIITPQNKLTPQTKTLIASCLKNVCSECNKKKHTLTHKLTQER